MKIYIATHKECDLPKEKGYIPLLVGANQNSTNIREEVRSNYLLDNTGEHISNKNPHYCELTGLYWIWKNTDSDVTGLVHYRRYFMNSRWNLLREEQVLKLLNRYDMILPQEYYLLRETVWQDYASRHGEEELYLCKCILEEGYPEYLDSFHKVFHAKHFYPFNMFITSKVVLEEYCQWLFSILFQVEQVIDMSKRDAYNQRLYGFLSERLLNVWVLQKRLRIKEVNVKNIEGWNGKEYIKNRLKKSMLLLGRR